MSNISDFHRYEASFHLIRRDLQANGNPNPTSADAGKWAYETFDEPMGVWASEEFRYFDEFYGQPIQTIHSGSMVWRLSVCASNGR